MYIHKIMKQVSDHADDNSDIVNVYDIFFAIKDGYIVILKFMAFGLLLSIVLYFSLNSLRHVATIEISEKSNYLFTFDSSIKKILTNNGMSKSAIYELALTEIGTYENFKLSYLQTLDRNKKSIKINGQSLAKLKTNEAIIEKYYNNFSINNKLEKNAAIVKFSTNHDKFFAVNVVQNIILNAMDEVKKKISARVQSTIQNLESEIENIKNAHKITIDNKKIKLEYDLKIDRSKTKIVNKLKLKSLLDAYTIAKKLNIVDPLISDLELRNYFSNEGVISTLTENSYQISPYYLGTVVLSEEIKVLENNIETDKNVDINATLENINSTYSDAFIEQLDYLKYDLIIKNQSLKSIDEINHKVNRIGILASYNLDRIRTSITNDFSPLYVLLIVIMSIIVGIIHIFVKNETNKRYNQL